MILSDVKVSINNHTVLNNINFILNQNDKVGLVGINGSGKSTLLKTIVGKIKIDSGNIKLSNETIGYLKQEIMPVFNKLSIIEYIKSEIGIDKLEIKLQELENNLNEDNMGEYGDILNKYLSIDGYNFEDNLKVIVSGLKLNESLDSKIEILSGGEKIKVLLASLLLSNSDILLLDEPTNNLDLEALEWLENYLKSTDKKMIIVSHDEFFLNNITNKICELDNGKLFEYNMSYSQYLIEKDREYNRKLEEYSKAIEEKDKLKKQVQKAKEWANKGNNKKAHNDNDKLANNFAKEKTNNSNVSKLSRALEKIEVPNFEEKKPINFFFTFDNIKGNKDIVLENLVCGYDNFRTPILNTAISFGQKLQINGGNGSGKTTLINTILGNIKPLEGRIIIGNNSKIGYISQDTLSTNDDSTVLEYLKKDKEDVDLSLIFILLDKFNISYDDRYKKYCNLSPGERTRVNLVKIALDKTNVLILDEVTNHLDKEAIELIYELISTYEGTIISISHNRKYNEILNADVILDMETGLFKYNNFIQDKHR